MHRQRFSRKAIVIVAIACACTRPAPPALGNTAAGSFIALDEVPPLAIEMPPGARHDCRPSVRIRKRFAGKSVVACGRQSGSVAAAAVGEARSCIEHALAAGHPFVFELVYDGMARALVGIVDGDAIATYAVLFDRDPCGGDCPLRGVTTIERCARLVRAEASAACDVDVTRCFACEAPERVETCVFR